MTTKTKTKSQETQKERKKNWKEVYASVEDIQQFLSDRVLMRYNLVTHQTEVHWLTDFGDDLQQIPQWEREHAVEGAVERETCAHARPAICHRVGLRAGIPPLPLLSGAPATLDGGTGRQHHGAVAVGECQGR